MKYDLNKKNQILSLSIVMLYNLRSNNNNNDSTGLYD